LQTSSIVKATGAAPGWPLQFKEAPDEFQPAAPQPSAPPARRKRRATV
jgi:hypothetical protein